MNTYGVSFDGFKPDCGQEDFDKISKVYIPSYEDFIEKEEIAKGQVEQSLSLFKTILANWDAFMSARKAVLESMCSQVPGKEFSVLGFLNAVHSPHGDEDDIQKIVDWMSNVPDADELFREMVAYSCEVDERNLKKIIGRLNAARSAVACLRKAKEMYKMQHVFNTAEVKYKAKICREMVRELTEFKVLCDTYLTSYIHEDEEAHNIRENARGYLEYCEMQLKFYRKLRKQIDLFGIEEALKSIVVKNVNASDNA